MIIGLIPIKTIQSGVKKMSNSRIMETVVKLSGSIDPSLANLCDKGAIELFEGDYMERAADQLETLFK